MIQKEQIREWVEAYLKDTDYALQTLEIDKDNNILVEIDRLGVVDIDFCAELNRYLVGKLGDEDYALEVGSVSLTAPFISNIQYQKHLGHPVEVLASKKEQSTSGKEQGKKYHGVLVSVDEETFMVETKKETVTFRYDDIEYVKYDLKI